MLFGRADEQREQQDGKYDTDGVCNCGVVDNRAVRRLAVQQAAEAFRRKDEVRAGNRAQKVAGTAAIQKFFFSVNRYIAAAHRTIMASVWLVQLK